MQSFREMPTRGVRLDDLNLTRLLDTFRKGELGIVKRKWLHEFWRAVIDTGGMVRGTRCPLGNDVKVYVTEGINDSMWTRGCTL